jgi:heme/copper-type cytochrome/quinol oxidase subunit 4
MSKTCVYCKAWVYVVTWAIMVAFTISEVLIRFYAPVANYAIVVYIVLLACGSATVSALYHLHLRYEPRALSFFPIAAMTILSLLILASIIGG